MTAAVDPKTIWRVIDHALAEDLGSGDITSAAVIPEDARFRGVMTARQRLVVAGLDIAFEVFKKLDPDAVLETIVVDGDHIQAGTRMTVVEGNARAMLGAERTALNLLQHLSGIATLSHAFVERMEGTGAVLLDTRKTVPGLRELAKYAARMGGARNHRMGLGDGVLIKDNHIAVAGSVGQAVKRARDGGLESIEVECDTIGQVTEAIAAGADRLLLDNMDLETIAQAVELARGKAETEASGGVSLQTVGAIAKTGVDFISAGAITLSAPAVDIGLDWETEG
ncbi:MAG: carboxylating nicotinate-nucleotide diphosphorylase [Rhodospirillales bacterium]